MILFSISVILFSIHFSSVSLQTYTFSIALIWSDCYSTNITAPPILRLHQCVSDRYCWNSRISEHNRWGNDESKHDIDLLTYPGVWEFVQHDINRDGNQSVKNVYKYGNMSTNTLTWSCAEIQENATKLLIYNNNAVCYVELSRSILVDNLHWLYFAEQFE